MMRLAFFGAALLATAVPGAGADRTQVYSIQGADCGTCGDEIKDELKKVKGIKKAEFDQVKVELTVRMAENVPDSAVLEAVERAGMRAVVGPGQGSYLPHPEYPAGADVAAVTDDGSAVGPLDKLRVPGKYTVFDIWAEWCGPCRTVDERLREIAGQRNDVAVRKLNLVDFDSPLARELGPRLEALPYLVVFSPDGRRTDVVGVDLEKLDKSLSR